jgi:hypothetical protein
MVRHLPTSTPIRKGAHGGESAREKFAPADRFMLYPRNAVAGNDLCMAAI